MCLFSRNCLLKFGQLLVHFQKAGLNVLGFALRSCWYRTCSGAIPSASCLHICKKKRQKKKAPNF